MNATTLPSSVAGALQRAAQVNPTGPACITHRGGDGGLPPLTTTYASLLQTTTAIARVLARWVTTKGEGEGSAAAAVVAMLCRNHELALAYLFAAAGLRGCVAAPLNTRWAAPEAAAALADCDPAVIVCDADLWPLLHAAVSSSPNSSLRAIILLYTDEPVSSSKPLPPFTHPAAAATAASCRVLRHEEALGLLREGGGGEGEVEVEGDDTQCLVYTSGSTGEPKGVMLSHRAQLLQAQEKVTLGRYTPSTAYLSLAPLFHVAGLNSSVAVTMAGGAHVFVQAPGQPRGLAPPSLALQTVVAHGVDTLVVVPAMLSALLDAMETEKEKKKEQQRGETGAGVRFVLVGGQPLTEGLWRRAAVALPHARVVQSYACSEACSSITFLHVDREGPFPPAGLVGVPATPAIEVAILALPSSSTNDDNDDTNDQHQQQHQRRPSRSFVRAAGQAGEIATRGPHLMQGYWRRPGATRRALVRVDEGEGGGTDAAAAAHKAAGGGGGGERGGNGAWLCTGDVGWVDEQGRLWVAGRLADVIRSGGEKVMAAEVERALLAHPRVAQAAVVGAPDPGKLGERVVAFVVLRKGKEGEEHSSRSSSSSSSSPAGGGDVGEALRAWCRGRLAGYKVPKEVRAVASLPTTASGKVMKGRLKEEVVGTGVGARRSFL